MKRLLIVCAVLSIICITATASHAQYWAKTYEENFGDDFDYYPYEIIIQQNHQGGYIVAREEGKILTLDGNGDVIWSKDYGEVTIASIQQNTDNSYIVTGSKNDDVWLMKLTENGTILWQKTLGGNWEDSTNSVQQTSDGGYIVVGSTRSFRIVQYNYDMWILKFDEDGNLAWQKVYGWGDWNWYNDYGRSIQQTIDGGYIVAGNTYSFGAGTMDAWVMKLGETGDIEWQKTYGTEYPDYALSFQQTSDGGYVMAGRTSPSGTPDYYWVMKLENNGTISWYKIYNEARDSHEIQQTTDGGYILTGTTRFFSGPLSLYMLDIWLMKLDGNGDVLWQRYYEDRYEQRAYSVKQTTDGGFIVAGNTRVCPGPIIDAPVGCSTISKIFLMKLDGNGEIPDCNILKTRTISVSTESFSAVDSNATSVQTNAIVNNIVTTPQDNTVETQDYCTNTDGDNFPDVVDNCYYVENNDQLDTDEDEAGDACDNCPLQPNGPYLGTCSNTLDVCATPGYNACGYCGLCDMNQTNTDSDEWGDACDNCPFLGTLNQDDVDNDGIGDACDNCLDDLNQDQYDSDGDCIGNACDEFPAIYDSTPDSDSDGLGDICDTSPYMPGMIPVADGHYYHFCIRDIFCSAAILNEIIVGGEEVLGDTTKEIGIIEFDISNLDGLYTSGQMQAKIFLEGKCGGLLDGRCLSIYSIQDENENGIIEQVDINTEDYIAEVCANLHQGETITVDVTSALEHDLFDPDQTSFSGFVIDRSTDWEGWIEFCDHSCDPVFQPRLSVSEIDLDGDGLTYSEDNCPYDPNPDQTDTDGDCRGDVCDDFPNTYDPTQPDSDSDGIGDICDNCPGDSNPNQEDTGDGDGIGDICDNCPITPNPNQEDTYPPQGNNIGDACDCEADFDCNGGVDATDVTAFLIDFGRSTFFNPCTNADPCNGDVNCDSNVDATDVTLFLEDFGRSQFNNPCPPCAAGDWCVYP